MTKLFSMKSLAFAGAAAFALALVAAPKADAAETELKLTKENLSVNYYTGLLKVEIPGYESKSIDVAHTAEGWGVYFGSGKNASKIKTVVLPDPTTAGETSTPGSIYYDISNLLGKKITVGVAENAEDTPVTVDLKESPKLAAKDITDDLLVKGKVEKGKIYEYKMGTYGEWYEVDGNEEGNPDCDFVADVKRAKILGSTLYIRMANTEEVTEATVGGQETEKPKTKTVQSTPWSKEVKVKIKAKAKAPKVTIKTAKLTKAFEWNMNSKLEYRVVEGDKTTGWKDGSKATWENLIKNAAGVTPDKDKDKDMYTANGDDLTLNTDIQLTATEIENLVVGDAIASDISFQVRTKADTSKKKDASQITVVPLKHSLDAPDKEYVEIKMENGKGKNPTVSAAAITPKAPTGYMVQYHLGDNKWKNVKNATKIEGTKISGTISLRLVGDGQNKKNSVLPSAVTVVTIPKNGTKDSKTNNYGGFNNTEEKMSATGYKVVDNRWQEVKTEQYAETAMKDWEKAATK